MNENEIVKGDHADNRAAPSNSKPRKYLTPRNLVTGTLAALVILVGSGGLYALVWVSAAFDKLPEAVSFVAENGINLLVFVAVALTVILMARQWLAMEDAVETAKQSAIYANRAYVTADYGLLRGPGGLTSHLVLNNNGNTPANDVRVSFNGDYYDSPPYKVVEGQRVVYNVTGFTSEAKVGLLPPKIPYLIPMPANKKLSTVPVKHLRQGQTKFYVWGLIVYEDVFNKPHWTEFCFAQPGDSPRGYPCEYGNRAD
jgi:hypothetical protein